LAGVKLGHLINRPLSCFPELAHVPSGDCSSFEPLIAVIIDVSLSSSNDAHEVSTLLIDSA
jgi:propanediol dehydratase large subunit